MKTSVLTSLLVSFAISNVMSGTPSITYTGINESGVRLLVPASQDFQNQLRALTAGITHELLDQVLPYCVIVQNSGTKAIAAIRVVHDLKNDQGQPISHQFRLSTVAADPIRMMMPGQSRLIGPVPLIVEAVNRSRLAEVFSDDIQARHEVELRLAKYRSQQEIHISLDSIVFENGELIGPDKVNSLAVLNGWLRATKDLVDAASRMNDVEFKKYLSQVLDRPQKSISSQLEADQYDRRQQMLARLLLRDGRIFRDVLPGVGQLMNQIRRVR